MATRNYVWPNESIDQDSRYSERMVIRFNPDFPNEISSHFYHKLKCLTLGFEKCEEELFCST